MGNGDNWQKPAVIDIAPALRVGPNTLVIEAIDEATAGEINAAGLIGKISVQGKDAPAIATTTGADWEWAASEDATVWKPALVIGAMGAGPWAGISDQPASTGPTSGPVSASSSRFRGTEARHGPDPRRVKNWLG